MDQQLDFSNARALDRRSVTKLSGQLHKDLTAIAEQYGLEFEAEGKTRFSSMGLTMQVSFNLGENAQQAKQDAERVSFDQLADQREGLDRSMFGASFCHAGKTFRITGANLNAPKYPVIAEQLSNGREYKMPVSLVVSAMAGVEA